MKFGMVMHIGTPSDSVYRRNNEARAHIAMLARVSLFRRFTDINVHETGFVKI